MHAVRISNPIKADKARPGAPIPAERARNGRGFAPRRVGLPHLRMPRSRVMRYGAGLVVVAAAYVTALLLEAGTGKFAAFPFYAAVAAGAWLGIGPGLLSFVLSALAAADFWTPELYRIDIATLESPSFLTFIVFALLTLAWSIQRRRTQLGL